MMRVLLLGGTTEASQICRALATAGVQGIFSYAGRTATPIAQPLPTRIGGFGGVDGLVDYIRRHRITHLIDATHPFARQISRNATEACARTHTALIAFAREPWAARTDDNWLRVASIEEAVAALPRQPSRIFLAIGKQHLRSFADQQQHFYLLRLVDAPAIGSPFPNAEIVLARGPFTVDGDIELMRSRRITHIVAKNAGGAGARAKIDAARALGLPMILIDQPPIDQPLPRQPARHTAHSVDQIMLWLDQSACLGV